MHHARRSFFLARLSALALATGLGVAVTGHAQVLADLVNDYATTGAPLTATGTGSWNFYASTTVDPTAGTLTTLSFLSVIGDPFTSGYGMADHDAYSVPAVADGKIFADGANPNGSFLAWHPGNTSPAYIVISWTAGAGESGSVRVAGTFSRQGEPIGSVNFYIFVNGVQEYFESNLQQNDEINFDLTASIATGQTVSFVLDPNGAFGGDESLISASITAVPEPSAYAIFAGLGALGLAAWRRRAK